MDMDFFGSDNKEFVLCAACGNHLGSHRNNNEDNYYFNGEILPEDNDGSLYVRTGIFPSGIPAAFGVFDGMGGEADGERASFLAASVMQTEWKEKCRTADPLDITAYDLLLDMNDAVVSEAENRSSSMGSTAAVMLIRGGAYAIGNVGDSRIFLLDEQGLTRISEDHTDEEMLLRLGIKNRSPRLTQFLGLSPEDAGLEPYCLRGNFHADEKYLLCSDGLTGMVGEAEIRDILEREEDPQICVEKLIEAAVRGGGRDNITVLCLFVKDKYDI